MSTKRILSLVLALVMVLGTFGTVFAAEPTGNVKVDWLVEQGIVLGDAGGLRLEDGITRAEVSVIVAKALGLETEAAAMANIPSKFSDMRVSGYAWANGFVNVLNANGYISGYPDGTFGPAKDITYAEVASMLVRVMGGLTAAEAKTAVWPTTYLAKAASLGIFEGVAGVDYSASAVRGKIFEMVYNTLDKEVGNNTVVKAIVLENNRVEKIGANEVVVEIIRVEQTSNYAKESRLDKGDQKNFVIDAKFGDVENLLGQVANFTINKDGKIVKITPDATYKVVSGPATATKNKLTVNGVAYTVELDERYKGTDERIFRTYHNDTAYSYEDFYQDPATIKDRNRKDSFAVDYARVTVKNGKVLLADTYTFDDIAPVQEVKRDGLDVYVYNDFRDARVEKFEPRALVMAFNNGKFSRIERKDIKANDVVHVYLKNRMIVRQDALVEGAYQKVEKDRWNDYYAHIDDNAYYIGNDDYFRPVYAHDSKTYTTLNAPTASSNLAQFYKEEVTALIDINDSLQLFGANVKYNEGMMIIDQILAKGQGRFVQKDNEKLIIDEDYTSYISTHNLATGKTTTNQRLNTFDKGDLTFTVANGDKIGSLVRIATAKDIRDTTNTVKKYGTSWEMNNSFIKMNALDANGIDRYQVLDRTNIFVMDVTKDGKYTVNSIKGTTVADVVKTSTPNNNIVAFVLTDNYVSGLHPNVINHRNRITSEKDIAHTVIFLDTGSRLYADEEMVYVTNVYTGNSPHYLVGNLADNFGKTQVTRTALPPHLVSLTGVKTNDIVALSLSQNDDKIIQTVPRVVIAASDVYSKSYRVVEYSYSSAEYRRLVLQDANGDRITKFLARDFKEFGTITTDAVVTFNDDADVYNNRDIRAIRVYPRTTAVTANGVPGAVVQYPILLNAYQRLSSEITVTIAEAEGKTNTYSYVGAQLLAELVALEGKNVDLSKFVLKGETVINKIAKIEGRDVLNTALTAAETKVEANYTAESWKAFKTALTAVEKMPEVTQVQIDAKLAAINAALAKLAPVVDKTALIAALDLAAAKVEADYTAESWTEFQTALTAAKAMPETTQAEVDAKLAAVNAAIAKLVEVPVGPTATYTVVAGGTANDKSLTINIANLENANFVGLFYSGVNLLEANQEVGKAFAVPTMYVDDIVNVELRVYATVDAEADNYIATGAFDGEGKITITVK